MTDTAPEKPPRKTFSDLMAYRPQKSGSNNTGLKWALIITIVLIVIAFIAAIIILLPYLELLGL
ncbi:MAG TPA: hypothetical protein O0X27_03870 [Methanocorpusculum sp.]|nr:hypothetical protein [Methanocorpusculum sp.]